MNVGRNVCMYLSMVLEKLPFAEFRCLLKRLGVNGLTDPIFEEEDFLCKIPRGISTAEVIPHHSVLKTESARTSSSCWTKLCTKTIYTLLQAFVLLLQISYQKKSFLTTRNIENQSRSSAEFH